MTPNYDAAAIKAMEILRDNNITETPIDSLSILLRYPGVRVMSFSNMAMQTGMDRDNLVPLFGENQDAATFHLNMSIDDVKYVVVYNKMLPIEIIMRGIARELGHIALGHDGATRPTEVRRQEAMCFAHHLLSPRPIIHMLQESGIPLTQNILSDTTGCSGECVEGIQAIPATNVPKELNQQVRDLFSKGVNEYIRFHKASPKNDKSPIVDFGAFMEGYDE